jgi:hypothetical protein
VTARRKSAESAAPKAKDSRSRIAPAGETKGSRPKAARRPGKAVQKPESNGHVAQHGEPPISSMPGDDQRAGVAARPGTPSKAARSDQAERVFLSLFEALDAHAKSQGIGHVAQDAQFEWGESVNQELHPDLAFISFDRWAAYRHVPKGLTWHVVPELVVEIIRGSEQTEPISAWIEDYFHAGVNRVWVVYPDQLKVHDHDSLDSSRVLDLNQSLDGGSIMPGFQMPVKALIARRDS